MAENQKAVWSTAFVNTLPDSSFMLIMPGGKRDSEGKTTPRSLRKLPIKDASGKLDLPHLRNAIARIPQMTGVSDVKKKSLQAQARRLLANASKKALSLTQQDSAVYRAVGSLNPPYPGEVMEPPAPPRIYTEDVFDTYVIVRRDGKYFRLDYTISEAGDVTLDGDPQPVTREWVEIEGGNDGSD